jgi:nucleotide-binding universal stress UspA family protein
LAAVDFNDLDPPGEDTSEPLNQMILELAGSLAFLERSEFHVVHVWSAPAEDVLGSERTGLPADEVDAYVQEMRQHHEGWLRQLMDKAKNWIGHESTNPTAAKLHLLKGRARAVIPSLAEELNVDLMVMGTVGRTGIPGLIIGNTAESVLSQIHCSVLAVKPPGFVTPVTLEE